MSRKKDARPVVHLKLEIEPGKVVIFQSNGRKRVETSDGYVFVNTLVKANDGTFFDAISLVDEQSSGELENMLFFLRDGSDTVWQRGEDGWLEKLGIEEDDMIPYTYKHRGTVYGDIHVGEDGWSVA